MNRRPRSRARQKQINILHTTTRQRHSQKQVMQAAGWCGIVLAMIVAVGAGLHFGLDFVLDQVLYSNPHYALNEIDIQPKDHFSARQIRLAAGLEPKQNLWTLNLPQIKRDLEKLPYVYSAKVERHFPDKVTILIHERVPVVKFVAVNSDLGTRETLYLDRDGFILKPRDDESVPFLPEIVGLTNDADVEPGVRLDQPILARALEILDAIDHTPLHTTIDIRTIDLSQPLSITLVTIRDMTITFRLDYVDQQLQRLLQIVQHPDFQDRAIRTVDLTPEFNVPVTFYE